MAQAQQYPTDTALLAAARTLLPHLSGTARAAVESTLEVAAAHTRTTESLESEANTQGFQPFGTVEMEARYAAALICNALLTGTLRDWLAAEEALAIALDDATGQLQAAA